MFVKEVSAALAMPEEGGGKAGETDSDPEDGCSDPFTDDGNSPYVTSLKSVSSVARLDLHPFDVIALLPVEQVVGVDAAACRLLRHDHRDRLRA